MECLNDEEIRAWLDGGCDEATALAVETHLDGCRACDEIVGAVVKLEAAPGDRSARQPVLQKGGSLGRYRILDVLGSGGMGVVYAAHDETLGRTVAIKLLGSGLGASADAATRLEREAQAMARVSHPNVVAVYEIGTYAGASFVAMEHVDGVTLSEWLRERKPTLDEIVRLFREAAIGLHAVHRAGLVHRDFKPANVLVSRDGRVRIADFGLVQLVAGAATNRLSGTEPVSSSVTASGVVIGTPAYLAPEQLDGRGDARSDQFSFCVALFEACFGQRPFHAATLDELGAAVRSGALRLPKALPDGTRWLVPILRRGLAYDPSARFPDLGALITALWRSPARTGRWALATMGALAGVGALVFGLRAARNPADCSTVDRALAGIWDSPRREKVHAALASKQGPDATQAWEKVSTTLDAYAANWVGQRRAACLHPGNDDAARGLAAARVACLDRRLADLRALSDLLASSDLDATQSVSRAIAELRSPDRCEQEAAGVTDEQAVLARLTDARLLSVVGRPKEALDAARTVLSESERARPAVHAKALLRSGQLELKHSPDAGIAQLQQAVQLAETARDDEVLAEALAYLAFAMSQRATPPDLTLGEQYADRATAVLARLGGDRRLEPMILVARGWLLRARERYDEAVAQLERALTLLDRDPARDPRQHGRALDGLGITLAEMGRPKDAVPHFERALAFAESAEDPHSQVLFASVMDLGEALLRSGHIREAAPYLERAAALAELAEDPFSRARATAALALGSCRDEQGDGAAARTLFERALTIANALQPGHRLRFEAELALGEHLTKNGDAARGRALLEQALREGAPGQESAAKVRFALAQALPRTEHKRAHDLAEQARATYLTAGPRRAKEVAAIDVWLAKK